MKTLKQSHHTRFRELDTGEKSPQRRGRVADGTSLLLLQQRSSRGPCVKHITEQVIRELTARLGSLRSGIAGTERALGALGYDAEAVVRVPRSTESE
jgi:hypothetical protein